MNTNSAGTEQGIAIQTAIKAGERPGLATNHAESVVVTTRVGLAGRPTQHADCLVA